MPEHDPAASPGTPVTPDPQPSMLWRMLALVKTLLGYARIQAMWRTVSAIPRVSWVVHCCAVLCSVCVQPVAPHHTTALIAAAILWVVLTRCVLLFDVSFDGMT